MNSEAKKTPLHAWHKTHGAQMFEFGGWEMPLNYRSGIVEEHLAVRRFGGLFDVSHLGRFILTGKGALPFLQYVLANNAAALDPGQAQYTMLPNPAGGAIDDAYLYRVEEEEYLLVVNAANTLRGFAWLQEHLKKFPGTVMEDHTQGLAMVSLQGPKTKSLLESILRETRTKLPDPGRNNLRKAAIEGVPIIVARTGYTGEPLGFELFFEADRALPVWEKILHRGADQGIVPVGLGGRDTLRLEAALPLHGYELGLDSEGCEIPILALPHGKIAVSFSKIKGDFIGRESLWKQFQEVKAWEEGRLDLIPQRSLVPRRVWPVAILSEGVVRRNSQVYLGDLLVGRVTSGTMVPYWKSEGEGLYSTIGPEKRRRAIMMAYVSSEFKENQQVQVLSREKFLTGQLVKRHLAGELPPYARPILVEEIVVKRPGPWVRLRKPNHTPRAPARTARLVNPSTRAW